MRNINWTSRTTIRALVCAGALCIIFICFHANVVTLPEGVRAQNTINHELDARERCSKDGLYNENCIVLYTQDTSLDNRRQIHYKHSLLSFASTKNTSLPLIYTNVSRFTHPAEPKTKPETLFFSMATSSHRVLDPQAVLYTWLPDSNVHFLLTLPHDDPIDAESQMLKHLSTLGLSSYHVRRDTAAFYGDAWSSSLPRMVELAQMTKTKISHYVLMDDDTMVTSLVNYRHMLDEHNPDVQRAIGSPSENIRQASAKVRGGMGGYGGASVILTRSLAENVAKNWDEAAIIRYNHRAGDCMLSGAIGFVQGRPMASPNIYFERALHQNDISNPASSLIRGGFRWLTFHHWGWFDIYPDTEKYTQMMRVAEFNALLNAENLFQNHLLSQDSEKTVILTNGCCLVTYSPPLSDKDLYRMEAVAEDEHAGVFSVMNFDATHGPLRDYRREGVNKTTAWYTGITKDNKAGESFTMTYETADKEETQVVWVVPH